MPVIEPYDHDYDKEKDDDPADNASNDAAPTTDIIGKTFLMEPRDDGQRFREKIVEDSEHHEDQQRQHPKQQK